jgi:hydroxyethylthiazole kinase-like uncharacterized protein yjeF
MSFPVGDGVRFTEADITAVLDRADRYDVMVLGPGLGSVPEGFVEGLLAGWDGALLLDADGLNALSDVDALVARSAPTILTPHTGEFRRLTGVDPSYESATALSGDTGDVVLLKGSPTFVVGADRWVVGTGGPELATIGTGDVLSGAIGAYWAGGLDAATAARSGAFWHGLAGRRLAEKRTVTAKGLAIEIGSAERAAIDEPRSTDQPWS